MAKERAPVQRKPILNTVHWLAVGIVLVTVIGAAIIFLQERHQPNTNTRQMVATAPVAITPLHFTDFIGVVDAANEQSITATMMLTESNGQRHARQYHVAIDGQTTLQTITITTAGTAVGPLIIQDLKKRDTVQVYSPDKNLYDVTAFTANRLVKLVSS